MDLLQFDLTVFRAVHRGWHSAFLDPFFLVMSYLGLGQVQFVLSWGLIAWGSKKQAAVRGWMAPMLWVIAVTGLPLVHGIKSLVGRLRPSNLSDALPQEGHFRGSFPSGHTSTSFAIAFLVVLLTWDSPRRLWGIGALALAALIGLSRIYRGVHWPTDVLAGVFVGLLGACLVRIGFGLAGKWPKWSEPSSSQVS